MGEMRGVHEAARQVGPLQYRSQQILGPDIGAANIYLRSSNVAHVGSVQIKIVVGIGCSPSGHVIAASFYELNMFHIRHVFCSRPDFWARLAR